MTDHNIQRETSENRGRYFIKLGDDEAELTYSIASPKLIIADHTGVPPAFRGTGAAKALFEQLVTDARAEGVKIVPLCPFIDAQRRRNPDLADLFQV